MLLLDAAAVDRLIDVHFPQAHHGGRVMFTEQLTAEKTVIRLQMAERNLRPGNTISGPALFTLADYGIYVALLARLGEAGLQAVTTNISLNFMRRPEPGAILAEIRLIKTGRRLIVAEVEMRRDGHADLVAHAVGTYAMPG